MQLFDPTLERLAQGRMNKMHLQTIEPPRVSIVIPTHGRTDYLCEALESVRAQRYPHWECFVVGDDPSEFADKRCLVASFDDERMRFCEGSRGGANASRNLGSRMASGSIIFFLDDDDIWLPHKIDAHLAAHRTADLVFSDLMRRTCGHLNYDLWFPPQKVPADPRGAMATFHWCPPTSSCASIRRSIVAGESWDERLGSYQDWDMWFRILGKEVNIGWVEQPLTIFRQHGSERTSRNYQRRLEALEYLGRKFADDLEPAALKRQREWEFLRHVGMLGISEGRARALATAAAAMSQRCSADNRRAFFKAIFTRHPASRWQLALAELSWRLKRRTYKLERLTADRSVARLSPEDDEGTSPPTRRRMARNHTRFSSPPESASVASGKSSV